TEQGVSRARNAGISNASYSNIAFLDSDDTISAGYLQNSLDECEPFTILLNRLYEDRKSTRLNSSHVSISYAVFCLKKKNRSHNFSITYYLKIVTCKNRETLMIMIQATYGESVTGSFTNSSTDLTGS